MMMKRSAWLWLVLIAWLAGVCESAEPTSPIRPNVVWIIADDLGPELGCYGYPDVATPNLDRLSAGGRRFTHAFATAPVCSPSRTAFITGHYQTTVGGHHHDTRDKRELPDSIKTITHLMRQAGYFVTNGKGSPVAEKRLTKSHFNFVYDPSTFFDGSDWSQRSDPTQPFFATVQIKEPHRGFVRNERPRLKAPIPPYYPEHPVTRADWGNYLASIEVLDTKVGEVLDRLDAEGVAHNTIVFFFGDHGRPHVRGKQWLYDGGLHVPLLVRWPGHVTAGAVDDRLVSLLDLMPTTLAAVGSEIPQSPGQDLLNLQWPGHDHLFAARDRCGDAIDRIRSVRTRDFKYIRNFRPDLPYLQHSGYKKLGYPVETLMKVMHQQGRWDTLLMSSTRPEEELYDLRTDPNEMVNLATEPSYHATLIALRAQLDDWIKRTGDKGEFDESETVDLAAVKAEKWAAYENAMRRRGLDPGLSDREYLQWWKRELGVENASSR
ncbi:sulfatase family protein [Neorhodopirellula pilleata]|uniref:Arylsulfatase n=1 Tax=Neorhodopirellula pilleata TaxID=2714738 RepID=A0A5C6A885_9BACT|nr:sulfatase [Neorhodopirellula pilleata]TWT96232.1 Arylsulfatase [Neorhodopirellula pilleata]